VERGLVQTEDSIPELLLEGKRFILLPELVCAAASSFVAELQYRFISLRRRRSGCRDSILHRVSSLAHVCVCVCTFLETAMDGSLGALAAVVQLQKRWISLH
jgi:hypothetical protein